MRTEQKDWSKFGPRLGKGAILQGVVTISLLLLFWFDFTFPAGKSAFIQEEGEQIQQLKKELEDKEEALKREQEIREARESQLVEEQEKLAESHREIEELQQQCAKQESHIFLEELHNLLYPF